MGILQVTSERDGDFINRMYSYWPNAYVKDRNVYVFCGSTDGLVKFFHIWPDKRIELLGPLIPYNGTGEGWYWDKDGFIYLPVENKLLRMNPFSGEVQVSLETSAGKMLWQAHSSDDGQVHSATVKDDNYQNIGTVVNYQGNIKYFEAKQQLDESAITTNGKYLIIKEGNDNRIIDLTNNDETTVKNEEGAFGHSDCGSNFMIGEDDINGRCAYWNLDTFERRKLFDTWNMGHVSVRDNKFLISNKQFIELWNIDGTKLLQVEHKMIGDDYDHQVFANISPCGCVAAYVSNNGTNRFDVFLANLD